MKVSEKIAMINMVRIEQNKTLLEAKRQVEKYIEKQIEIENKVEDLPNKN